MARYDQCDGTCTVDCGHCKGGGRVNKIGTAHLEAGTKVLTTEPVGTDFGLPLVEPWHLKRTASVVREVRSHHRAAGAVVVWFQDGTKSIPLHGRSAWQEA